MKSSKKAPTSTTKKNSSPTSSQSASQSASTVMAPPGVRIGASLLFGLAVGVMGLPIAPMWKVVVLVVAAAAAMLLTFSHPYRREVKAATEKKFGQYSTSISNLVPIFPLWLALMVLPALPFLSIGLAVIAFIAAAIYVYVVFPHIDGTARLAH